MQLPRILRRAALALALALPACDSDDNTGPVDTGGNVVGSWDLVSLGGEELPLTETYADAQFGLCTYSLIGMSWTFLQNGDYNGSVTESVSCGDDPPAEPVTAEFAGTYRTQGDQLLLTADAPGATEGAVGYSVAEDTFTLREGSGTFALVYVFERADAGALFGRGVS